MRPSPLTNKNGRTSSVQAVLYSRQRRHCHFSYRVQFAIIYYSPSLFFTIGLVGFLHYQQRTFVWARAVAYYVLLEPPLYFFFHFGPLSVRQPTRFLMIDGWLAIVGICVSWYWSTLVYPRPSETCRCIWCIFSIYSSFLLCSDLGIALNSLSVFSACPKFLCTIFPRVVLIFPCILVPGFQVPFLEPPQSKQYVAVLVLSMNILASPLLFW